MRSVLTLAVFLAFAARAQAQDAGPGNENPQSVPTARAPEIIPPAPKDAAREPASAANQATPDMNPRPPARGQVGQKPESPSKSPQIEPTPGTTPIETRTARRRGRGSRRAPMTPTPAVPRWTPTPAARVPALRTDPRSSLFVVAAIGGFDPAPGRPPLRDERSVSSWIAFGILVIGLGAVTIRMLRHRRRLHIAMIFRRLRDGLRKDRRKVPRPASRPAVLKHP